MTSSTADPEPASPVGKIGLYFGYVPRLTEPFAGQIIQGILTRLAEYGKDLLIINRPPQAVEDHLDQLLREKEIEGLIFLPGEAQVVARVSQLGLPVLTIADSTPGINSVIVDDEMGSYLLAEHLALRGYQRVLYRRDFYDHPSGRRRFRSFQKLAQYLGMEVIDTEPADEDGTLTKTEADFLQRREANSADVVVVWADAYAYAVLRFCKAHKLRVPEDVAVAGFDGPSQSILFEPAFRLTTVLAPWLQVGEVAVDRLLEMCRGEQTIPQTVLPVNLFVGDTT